MGMRKTIQVDEDVWLQLVQLKYQLKVRNISEALRQILQSYKTIEPQNYKSTNLQNYKTVETADLQKASSAEEPERRRSPLDDLEDVALIRNVRDMSALAARCKERNLLLYSFEDLGLPSTVAVIRPSYAEFVKSSAEQDYTPPSKLEDKLISILRGKPHDLDPEEKYIVTLFALSLAGEILYDGKRWVTPEKKTKQQEQQQPQQQPQQQEQEQQEQQQLQQPR